MQKIYWPIIKPKEKDIIRNYLLIFVIVAGLFPGKLTIKNMHLKKLSLKTGKSTLNT